MISSDLPLIDLHRHLEGNVRPETVFDLRQQRGLPLPVDNPRDFRRYVQVDEPQPGLLAFFEKFDWITGALADYDACERIAYESVVDARAEGLDYFELRFSPLFMSRPHGLDPAGVTEAVVAGVERGRVAAGVGCGLIGIMSRTFGPEQAMVEWRSLLTQRNHLVAVDLAGDEIHFPAGLFAEHFRLARDAQLHITVHAGEAAGPESIWQAIHLLGAERIGHGFAAAQDPALVAYLAERQIGLEMSLTSNVQISAFRSYADHPVRELLEAGVLIALNTDDPGISAVDIRHEYEVAAPAAGLSAERIRQLQANALEMAFLPAAEKQRLLADRRQ
jgi:adenosine deaminase